MDNCPKKLHVVHTIQIEEEMTMWGSVGENENKNYQGFAKFSPSFPHCTGGTSKQGISRV